MKRFTIIPILLSIFATIAIAKSNMSNAVFIEAKDMKWTPVAEFPGVQVATVEGDASKGAHHSFMKFDAGFAAPMHQHTSDHFATVIAGTFILTVDGKENRLTPGSFFSFKKKQMHSTTCAAGAECIIFVDGRSKWDVIPEKKMVTQK